MAFGKPFSEKTAELIDSEVKKLIEQSQKTAVKILKENKKGFEELAALLLEKEVIFSEDLERIFGPRKGGVNPNAVINDDTPIELDEPVEEKPAPKKVKKAPEKKEEPKEEVPEAPVTTEPEVPAEPETPAPEAPSEPEAPATSEPEPPQEPNEPEGPTLF